VKIITINPLRILIKKKVISIFRSSIFAKLAAKKGTKPLRLKGDSICVGKIISEYELNINVYFTQSPNPEHSDGEK
jgi:hypothetical protein